MGYKITKAEDTWGYHGGFHKENDDEPLKFGLARF